MKKIVGIVTEEEKASIKRINAHRCSLEELLLILPEESELQRKVIADLDKTHNDYQSWWNMMNGKYHWEKGKGDWRIEFESNEIVIDL